MLIGYHDLWLGQDGAQNSHSFDCCISDALYRDPPSFTSIQMALVSKAISFQSVPEAHSHMVCWTKDTDGT